MKKIVNCLFVFLLSATILLSNNVIAVDKSINNYLDQDLQQVAASSSYSKNLYRKSEWVKSGSVEYPISQYDSGWKEFDSHEEMVRACTVPAEILKSMSTDDLLNLAYDYPLLIDMYSYNTIQDGIKALISQSNIFRELYKRSDFKDEIINDEKQMNAVNDFNQFKKNVLIKALRGANAYSTDLISNGMQNISAKYSIKRAVNTKKLLRVDTISIGNGKTTKGLVYVYAGATWASDLNKEYRSTYPKATLVSSSDNRYNCHSYAWYSQSVSTNHYWINSPDDYISSGLYKSINKSSNNCKIEYVNSQGNIIHSGIVTNSSNMMVESKWGAGPLMIHSAGYSPYTSTVKYKYYKKK